MSGFRRGLLVTRVRLRSTRQASQRTRCFVFKTLLREVSIIVDKQESGMTIQGSDTPSGCVRAMLRLERGRTNLVDKNHCRMDLSTVEAGLTRARTLNSYPEVVEGTWKKLSKARRSERDVERAKIKKLADTILLLRQKLAAAERNIARITSHNTRLASEKSASPATRSPASRNRK